VLLERVQHNKSPLFVVSSEMLCTSHVELRMSIKPWQGSSPRGAAPPFAEWRNRAVCDARLGDVEHHLTLPYLTTCLLRRLGREVIWWYVSTFIPSEQLNPTVVVTTESGSWTH